MEGEKDRSLERNGCSFGVNKPLVMLLGWSSVGGSRKSELYPGEVVSSPGELSGLVSTEFGVLPARREAGGKYRHAYILGTTQLQIRAKLWSTRGTIKTRN